MARPKKPNKSRQLAVSVDPETEAAINQWRQTMAVQPSLSAAALALIKIGLKSMSEE